MAAEKLKYSLIHVHIFNPLKVCNEMSMLLYLVEQQCKSNVMMTLRISPGSAVICYGSVLRLAHERNVCVASLHAAMAAVKDFHPSLVFILGTEQRFLFSHGSKMFYCGKG